MLPILLVSKEEKLTKKYIEEFIRKYIYKSYEVFSFEPSPNIITIEQIHEISNLFKRVSEKKLVIVYSFNSARMESQNAFLKTLEEKTENTQFILVVSDETAVLSTILSRCKVVILKNSKPRKEIKDENSPEKLSYKQLLEKYSEMNKEKALKLCDEWLYFYHSQIVNSTQVEQSGKISKEIMKVRNLIEKNNLNAQMAIDHLILLFKGSG